MSEIKGNERYYQGKERHKHQRGSLIEQEVLRTVVNQKVNRNTSDEDEKNESSGESFQEGNKRFKNDMDVSLTIQRNEQEHEEFMKYLAMKRKREQEKNDLRRKLVGNKNESESLVVRNQFNRRKVSVSDSRLPQQGCHARSPKQHILQTNDHGLSSNQQMQKPEGYDERRRQRELEKQKQLDSTRRDGRRSVDHRSPVIKDHFSEKQNCDYNNRGRERTRSSEDYRKDKRYSRESSDPYSRDSSGNRRNSRTSEISKRKVERTRSSSEDSFKNGRRKRQRNRSNESTSDAKPASHLRELEFRARALQSLLNKKEETNKAIRRGER